MSCPNQQAIREERTATGQIHSPHEIISTAGKTGHNYDGSERKQNLHPRVRVDQAVRPLPPKTLGRLSIETDIYV